MEEAREQAKEAIGKAKRAAAARTVADEAKESAMARVRELEAAGESELEAGANRNVEAEASRRVEEGRLKRQLEAALERAEDLEGKLEESVLSMQEGEEVREALEEKSLDLELQLEGVRDELEAARAEAADAKTAAAAAAQAVGSRCGAITSTLTASAPGTPLSGARSNPGDLSPSLPRTPLPPSTPAQAQAALLSPVAQTPDSMAS